MTHIADAPKSRRRGTAPPGTPTMLEPDSHSAHVNEEAR
jgi:hypothetical protein